MKKNIKIISFLIGLSSVCVVAMASISGLKMTSAATVSLQNTEDSCSYTVQKGDTLSRIASHLTGKTENYKQIMQCNGLTSDVIYPDKQLRIPNQLMLKEYQCASEQMPTPIRPPSPTPASMSTLAQASPSTVTPIPTLTPPPKKSEHKILAEIEGIVFEDKNENGRYDPHEPGIPEIEVVLIKSQVGQTSGKPGRVNQRSDKQGKFLFVNVDPGQQAVGLYETGLPEGYRLTTDPTVVISLTEGDKGYVAFGLLKPLSSNM
jgi:LysM repeat protein